MNFKKVASIYIKIITILEKALALVVIGSVIAFAIQSIDLILHSDWNDTGTFYELIFRILLIVICLELARMLITHSLNAVLELLAFVIARKMLKPDLESVDVVFGVVSFVALLAARKYFFRPEDYENTEPTRLPI